jgi:hypothetical protein
MLRPTLTAVLLLAAPAFADDSKCKIEFDKDDVIARQSDAVAERGKTYGTAMAIDGDVVVRAKATVKNAVAFNGSVILEPGAHVTGSAIAAGGSVKVSSSAKVDGSTIVLDRDLKVTGEDKKTVKIDAEIEGKKLGDIVLTALLQEMRSCSIKPAAH